MRYLHVLALIAAILVIGGVMAGCDFPRCGVLWPCDK